MAAETADHDGRGVRGARGPGELLLVGRGEQLSAVNALADGLAAGRGGILWIEGEPGIGKSALADALLARVRQAGGTVLRAGGDELIEAFPLRLMASCLGVSGRSVDEARREIADLLRGASDAAGAADRVLAAAERMLELVDRLCARGPVALVADDLQWADGPSLRVWGRLARTTDQIPLLLVGVARPAPNASAVQRLRESVRADPRGTVLELRPLGGAEVARLAGAIAGGEPGPRLDAELARAGGNPLYVRVLVDALIGEGLIATGRPAAGEGSAAELVGPSGVTPESLAQAIGRRLGYISPETLRILRLAALLGIRFEAGQLAAVAGTSPARVGDAVAEAVAAGVVDGADPLSFRHALVQQVLVQQTPAGMRRTLHGHIARTLAETGAGPDAVARHLLAMPEGLDPWAVQWLAEVPQGVLYGAASVSARLLERAVAIADGQEDPDARGGGRWEVLATRLAQVQFFLGRDEAVVDVAGRVARRTRDPGNAARMTELVVRSAGRMGRAAQALAAAERVMRDGALPLAWRSRLRAWSAVVLSSSGRPDEAHAEAAVALEEARDSGDSLAVAYAHHASSIGAPLVTAIAHAEAAIPVLGEDAESTDLRMLLTFNRLIWLFEQGREEEYEKLLPQALVMAERVGTVRTSGILGAAAGVAHARGAWDEALVYLDEIDPEFSATVDQVHLHGLAALIELHRGERERAARHLAIIDEVMPEGVQITNRRAKYIYEARAVAAEVDGSPERALELLASWMEMPRGLRRDERNEEAPHIVRLALAAGDQELALATTAAIEADARQEPLSRRVVTARLCRGQVDDDAAELLAVAESCRGEGWPFVQAFALEEAAVRLAADGDTVRARAALTDAVRLYAEMGATWDVRRADARLRALGVRRGPRSAHRRETTGWGALTVSEARIVELVGQGWSNPDIAVELFLSRRTVQTHVSNILGKLQLHSRIEVVRAMAERGGVGA